MVLRNDNDSSSSAAVAAAGVVVVAVDVDVAAAFVDGWMNFLLRLARRVLLLPRWSVPTRIDHHQTNSLFLWK